MGPFDTIKNRLQFQVEWLLLRGPLQRIFVIALVIGFVSLTAGLLVLTTTSQFDSLGAAIWWTFLRLTDPGYLGDDQGTLLRFVSTIVTVLGYVLFMGSLIAIMTQWLNATIDRLEQGLTPIVGRHHVVVLGWGLCFAEVVRDLMESEGRVRRFLDRVGGGSLHVAILAEDVGHEIVQELKDRLGPLWSPRRITLRSGSPLNIDHLRRVDFLNAAAILLPDREIVEEDEASHDAVALKTLLSTAAASRQLEARLPLMVAEISDARVAPMAVKAYGGPIEVVSSDRLVARLITQTIRNPGLPRVFTELLTHEGSELYLRRFPQMVGSRADAVREAFDQSVFIGVVRDAGDRFVPYLVPPEDFEIEEEDRLVILARDYETSIPRSGFDSGASSAVKEGQRRSRTRAASRKILMIGWNQTAPEIVRELGLYENERCQLDSLTVVSSETRLMSLQRRGVDGDRVGFTMFEGDATSPSDLAKLDLESYDHIVLLAADRFETEVDSDARTTMSSLMLKNALAKGDRRPRILIELNDSRNEGLFDERGTEVIVSPMVLGHVLSQVALRRELRTVYDEIFGSYGAELVFRNLDELGIEPGKRAFPLIQRESWNAGEIAIGLVMRGEVLLNPNQRATYELRAKDQVLVLTSN